MQNAVCNLGSNCMALFVSLKAHPVAPFLPSEGSKLTVCGPKEKAHPVLVEVWAASQSPELQGSHDCLLQPQRSTGDWGSCRRVGASSSCSVEKGAAKRQTRVRLPLAPTAALHHRDNLLKPRMAINPLYLLGSPPWPLCTLPVTPQGFRSLGAVGGQRPCCSAPVS